jgi:hypothetical protein
MTKQAAGPGWVWAAVASIVAAFVLAACGSGSSAVSSTTKAATAPVATAPAVTATAGCPAASEVSTAMRATFTVKSSGPFGAGVQCTYASAGGDLDIDLNPHSTTAFFSAERKAFRAAGSSVPDTGTWAYWLAPEGTFAAAKGSTFVSIASTATGSARPPESGFAELARELL